MLKLKGKVETFSEKFLARVEKMTLVPDGWENVRHEHVVKFLAIVGKAAVFLDTIPVGSFSQTGENQAALVQSVLDSHGGVEAFATVASDSTQSLNVRETIAASKNIFAKRPE